MAGRVIFPHKNGQSAACARLAGRVVRVVRGAVSEMQRMRGEGRAR